MTLRKQYVMDEAQEARLLEAMKPVPLMIIGGMAPESQQAKANRAWQELGEEMGFLWQTVLPTSEPRTFTAEPMPDPPKAA
jgi:hypothetical protein